MIKQFNFYDIYGYLLPGIALVGLIWVPIGLISKSWPEQDISKALFLVVLAYFLGHLLQTIATNAVPSKVMRDQENRPRFPSDRLLDASLTDLSQDFKTRLARQVRDKFNLDLHIDEDGEGKGNIFSDRNTAFFQARGYLIAKKTAHYVEQFEGLYAMMRGLACALLAGSCYTVGWAFAFHRHATFLRVIAVGCGILAIGIALVSSFGALSRNPQKMKRGVTVLAVSLLVAFWASGFWAGDWQSSAFWNGATPGLELVLWLAACLSLIAAARCFSSYRSFAIQFAQSVWRDFSVHLIVQESADDQGAQADSDDSDED